MTQENLKEKRQAQSAQKQTIEQMFYRIGWIALVLAAVYFVLQKITGFTLTYYLPPCIFHVVTGLDCPGCGGTRATVSFLHGHFLKSFIYHPIVLYTGIVYGWFMVSQTIERCSRGKIRIGLKFRPLYLWIALGLIIINCLVKNVLLVMFGIDLLI